MLEMATCLVIVITAGAINPVVLVPGALASHLEVRLNKSEVAHMLCSKKADWYTVWLQPHQMLGPQLYCWADNFNIHFNGDTFHDAPGVEFRVPEFGRTGSVRFLDDYHLVPYFDALIEGLLRLPGARDGLTVRAAPYDFRYTPPSKQSTHFFIKLKGLVEETSQRNGGRRVALVSHSLGALITSTFLNTVTQAWKDTYVHSWSSIGGVFGGTVKSLDAMVSGSAIDYFPKFLTSIPTLRGTARSVMCNYYMLPRAPIWSESETLVSTPSFNYSLSNLDDMFTDIGYSQGVEKWRSIQNATYIGDPGVETYCFNGKDIATEVGYVFHDQLEFPDSTPLRKWGTGDGTVEKRSLKVCHRWQSTRGIYEYSGNDFGEHFKILNNPALINQIIKIIKRKKSSGISQSESCAVDL